MTEDFRREAELWGIETEFFDVRGLRHEVPPHTIEKVVAALSGRGRSPAVVDASSKAELAHQGDGRRGWIVAAQLYSLRSQRNWGLGDFTDLAAVIEIAAEKGAAGVGLNPLHALFGERPVDASPYSPNSRLALNPLYIDVEAIPHFPNCYVLAIENEFKDRRQADLIDYEAVAKLKWPALRLAHRTFRELAGATERAEFASFCNEGGSTLLRFAAFETLRGKFHTVWWEWPLEWRDPGDDALRHLAADEAEEIEFHQFVQWAAARQLQACSALANSRGMPIGLYIDLAVGVDASGADAWLAQDAMLRGISVGAPPDEFNPAGQDWGLTTFDPHGLVRQDFAPFREVLRAAMRHAGAIRIDHVLGLMRMFVIPHGLKPQDGAYLRFPFAAMLNVVAEESRRCRCIVIGEDLGTVPENFRDIMYRWGLWSYLVMLFEREWDGSFKPPDHYRENALATFGTHDMATFSGWMSGYDLDIKRAIGVDPGENDEDRERSRAALRRAIGEGRHYLKAIEFLAATATRLVSISLEDVLEMREQINVPGTVLQHPNWRRRLPVDVETMRSDQRMCDVADVLRRSGRGIG